MATLNRIRKHGVLLLVVVGLALLAFIVGDFVNSSATFFGEANANVAKINGKAVKVRPYMEAIEQMTEVYKMELGEGSIDDKVTESIHQSVWEATVKEKTLTKETDAIGMQIPESELHEMMMGNNIHPLISSRNMFVNPQTGTFDREMVKQFHAAANGENANVPADQLRLLKYYWAFWENNLKQMRLEEKYGNLLRGLLVVNSLEAKKSFEHKNNPVDFAYATKSFFQIPDSLVEVSDSEVKALYKKRREQHKQEATRDIKYVMFDIKPSEEDFQAAESWINNLKERFETTEDIVEVTNSNSDITYKGHNLSKNEVDVDFREFAFSGKKNDCMGPVFTDDTYKIARIVETGIMLPDSVKLRHIALQKEDEATTQILADSIVKALKGGADFGELAQKYSLVRQTAANGGEIGWVKESDLEKEMVGKVFAAKANEIVQHKANYGGGIQIFQIMERPAATPKVKLAILARKVVPSSATQARIFQQAKQFAFDNTHPDSLEASALRAGLSCRPQANLNINETAIANLKNARQIVRWAFKAELNEVSDIFECDDKIVIAGVTKVKEKGYRPLDEIRGVLALEIRNNKKFELAKKELEGKTVAELATNPEFTVDTLRDINFSTPYAGALGREPELFALASIADQNVVSAPVKGFSGIFIFDVLGKKTGETQFDVAAEKAELNRNAYMISYMGMDALKKAANIDDMRYKYF